MFIGARVMITYRTMSTDSGLNKYFQESPFNDWMDVQVGTTEGDRPIVRVPFNQKLTNQGASIHGGVLASLVDVAGGAAVLNALGDNGEVFLATTDMDIRYLRPATEELTAIGSVERVGESLSVATVEITQESSTDSNVVALGSVSFKHVH